MGKSDRYSVRKRSKATMRTLPGATVWQVEEQSPTEVSEGAEPTDESTEDPEMDLRAQAEAKPKTEPTEDPEIELKSKPKAKPKIEPTEHTEIEAIVHTRSDLKGDEELSDYQETEERAESAAEQKTEQKAEQTAEPIENPK